GSKSPTMFQSRLILLVVHPSKTILQIKEIATLQSLSIESIKMHKNQDMGTQIEFVFRVACKKQIDKLIQRLNASDDILMIRRPLG
ncbi:MAG TPA: hypothetical protein VJZ27_16185, partial [Aggregatilineales bacterium]|nr:hypothetical protein [Aggregatilineales bacterium]